MSRRGFPGAVCGALALLLTIAGACPAQIVFFPVGRASPATVPIGPRSFAYFPTSSYGSTYYPSAYNGYSPYGYSGMPAYNNFNSYNSYSYNAVTPLYYGAASFAPIYSGGYSTARLVSPPLDAVSRSADAVTPAAYTTSPFQSSNYASLRLVSPPLSLLTDDTAKVEVRAPTDAEIWFDGQKTSQTGTDRAYTSPALESGQNYVYEVRARWNADGRAVDQTRKVAVHAGDRVLVNFLGADASK